jgi:FG-GAP-like repeat
MVMNIVRSVRGPAFYSRTAILVALIAIWASPAAAQLSRLTPSIGVLTAAPAIRGTDIGYDPTNHVYLMVGGFGAIYGLFVSSTGTAAGSAFRIGSSNSSFPFGHFPRCRYSPDVNNGQGGFLVTWHESDDGKVNVVHAVVIAYPTGVISANQIVSDGAQGGSFWETGAALAYSRTSQRFLVVWSTLLWGIQGRFVDVNGAPIGGVIAIENPGGARSPGVSWNPVNDRFGVSYSGWDSSSAFARFRTVGALDGSIVASPKFGRSAGTFMTDVDLNPTTGHYVMVWVTTNGSGGTMEAEFDENGNLLGQGLASARFGSDDNATLRFNNNSGTFLTIGSDTYSVEVVGVELNGQGAPTTGTIPLTSGATTGSFYPRLTARTDAKEWGLSYARNLTTITTQIIGTSTVSAPPPPCTGCGVPPPVHPDITVFRPDSGNWYSLTGASDWKTMNVTGWGLPGDIPLRADFDGDGIPDLVVYRPSNGTWYILFSSTNFSYSSFAAYQWGAPGDIPMPGDYDGDGKADIVVYRPSNGFWYGLFSSTSFTRANIAGLQWGLPGDIPVRADFDGDGRLDLAVYRPSEGTWYVLYSSSNYSYANWTSYQWGLPGDIPMAEDIDGDGKTDLVVYRPSDGTWYMRFSSINYSLANWAAYQWGLPGDIPIIGDFDGDRKGDLVVWRPSNGTWYLRFSSDGYSYATVRAYGFGLANDTPLSGIMR